MKKTIVTTLMILIVINLSYAYCYNELNDKAEELKNDDPYVTAFNIERFVEATNKVKFYHEKRNVCDYWDSNFKGDCTDRANLAVELLRRNNIRAKQVHGWCDRTKHDWYEFNIDGTWLSYEPYKFNLCNELKKKGDGIW